jgi:hypothetical protein
MTRVVSAVSWSAGFLEALGAARILPSNRQQIAAGEAAHPLPTVPYRFSNPHGTTVFLDRIDRSFWNTKKATENGDTQPRCALRIAWLGDVDLQSLNRAGYAGKLMRSYHFLRERVQ